MHNFCKSTFIVLFAINGLSCSFRRPTDHRTDVPNENPGVNATNSGQIPAGADGIDAANIDPQLFGLWYNYAVVQVETMSRRDTGSFELKKFGETYAMEESVVYSLHRRYLIETDMTTSPFRLTRTVLVDFNNQIPAGTQDHCLYKIEVITKEVLDDKIVKDINPKVPRRMLTLKCSGFGNQGYPNTLDKDAFTYHNYRDSITHPISEVTPPHGTQPEISELDFSYSHIIDSEGNPKPDRQITDLDLAIYADSDVLPENVRLVLKHEDGSELVVHDRKKLPTGRLYRSIGSNGSPLDLASWRGKKIGNPKAYRLRVENFSQPTKPLAVSASLGITPNFIPVKEEDLPKKFDSCLHKVATPPTNDIGLDLSCGSAKWEHYNDSANKPKYNLVIRFQGDTPSGTMANSHVFKTPAIELDVELDTIPTVNSEAKWSLMPFHHYGIFETGYLQGNLSNKWDVVLKDKEYCQGGQVVLTSLSETRITGHFVVYFYDHKVSGDFDFPLATTH